MLFTDFNVKGLFLVIELSLMLESYYCGVYKLSDKLYFLIMIYVFQHLGDLGSNKGSLLPKVSGTRIKDAFQQLVFEIFYSVLLLYRFSL
jgi:hypothetical protein